jgi:LmbE family N-acetylglucosaminyl deacetylase
LLRLTIPPDGRESFRLLCLGAHSDDIEIGCGGTILRIAAEVPDLVVRWIVFSGDEQRGNEARNSAAAVLEHVSQKQIEVLGFRDGYFPSQSADIKDYFENVKRNFDPSLILTHWQNDAHQDHRLLAELTFNTFRNHLVFEYEIPKYDGDLSNPNLFVPLTRAQLQRKIDTISHHFVSQRGRN